MEFVLRKLKFYNKLKTNKFLQRQKPYFIIYLCDGQIHFQGEYEGFEDFISQAPWYCQQIKNRKSRTVFLFKYRLLREKGDVYYVFTFKFLIIYKNHINTISTIEYRDSLYFHAAMNKCTMCCTPRILINNCIYVLFLDF